MAHPLLIAWTLAQGLSWTPWEWVELHNISSTPAQKIQTLRAQVAEDALAAEIAIPNSFTWIELVVADTSDWSYDIASADIPNNSSSSVVWWVEVASLTSDFPTLWRETFARIFPEIAEAKLDAELEKFNDSVVNFYTLLRTIPTDLIPEPVRLWETYSNLFLWFPEKLKFEAVRNFANGPDKSKEFLMQVIYNVAPEYWDSKAATDVFLDTEGYEWFLEDNNMTRLNANLSETEYYRVISLMRSIVADWDDADAVYEWIFDIMRQPASQMKTDEEEYIYNAVGSEESLSAVSQYAEVSPYFISTVRSMKSVVKTKKRSEIAEKRAIESQESLRALKALVWEGI